MSEEYELQMRFITCGEDGPHEAGSYVSGWECSHIESTLGFLKLQGLGLVIIKTVIHKENLPQIDLIAMANGFKITEKTENVEGWLNITISNENTEQYMFTEFED